MDEHIEITPGVASGKPRIAGHQVKVMDIAIWHDRLGHSKVRRARSQDTGQSRF